MAAVNGHHVPGTGFNWRHGYHPLTQTVATRYGKKWTGDHGSSRHKTLPARSHPLPRLRPQPASPSHPLARTATLPPRRHTPPRDVREMSDAELETQLLASMDSNFDEQAFKRLSAEIDRREAETRKKNRAQQATADRRARKEAKQAAHLSELLDSGMDEEEAVAEAYGISIDRQRRNRAIADLRGQGYTGAGVDELGRKAYRDHVYRQWLAAENDTRGVLVTREGQAAGVDPASLFTGSEARARKWASEELKAWWDKNGRMTFAEWKAHLLADSTAARRHRETQRGDFHA